jgi:hypothetical protein
VRLSRILGQVLLLLGRGGFSAMPLVLLCDDRWMSRGYWRNDSWWGKAKYSEICLVATLYDTNSSGPHMRLILGVAGTCVALGTDTLQRWFLWYSSTRPRKFWGYTLKWATMPRSVSSPWQQSFMFRSSEVWISLLRRTIQTDNFCDVCCKQTLWRCLKIIENRFL